MFINNYIAKTIFANFFTKIFAKNEGLTKLYIKKLVKPHYIGFN
ncbi:conserved hypothetical protein (plasmid) [Borreliella afzelii ACA-1]|nr:conserved hypothetical protein [Borreliella afzelii ACA-1]